MNKEFELTRRQKLQIYPLGDLHIGSPNFSEEFMEHWIDIFNSTKSKKLIYLQGDLIDVATKRLGNSAYEQDMSVNDQIEQVLGYLEPLKKYIAGSVSSNHPARIKKEFDLDIEKVMADALGCEYGASLYHNLKINGEDFKVFAQHGSKTSQQLHLMLGQVMRQTQHVEADLVLYGHCHHGESMSLPSVSMEGYKRKTIVLTGHFLTYKNSYAEHMGLRPNPCCFPIVNVGYNCAVDVKIVNEDEVF